MAMTARAFVVLVFCVVAVWSDNVVESGFEVEELPFGGVALPVKVKFTESGKVLVLEKNGRIKQFESLEDRSTGVTLCDMRDKVDSFWDHGMLGMALHPDFEQNGQLFVAYTAAAWSDGTPTDYNDACDGEHCESSARVSRVTVTAPGMCEEVELLAGACSTSQAHHISDVLIGADGYLYVSVGDSSHFTFTDHGIDPNTGEYDFCVTNPDEDVGATAYGSYRAQIDHLLQGKLLRLDYRAVVPEGFDPRDVSVTAAPINRDPESPVVAKGLRMPFRMAQDPRTGDIFIADVGGAVYETLWRLPYEQIAADATEPEMPNFGWPCREGGEVNAAHDAQYCDEINQEAFLRYNHNEALGDCAATGSSSISAIGFYSGDMFPAEYHGALFFGDFARECIWYIRAGGDGALEVDADGRPVVRTFDTWLPFPVDIVTAPDGSLVVTSVFGALRRVTYGAGVAPPAVALESDVLEGDAPLSAVLRAVVEDADPTLVFEWDCAGDGAFTAAAEAREHACEYPLGVYEAAVRATSGATGLSAVAYVTVVAGVRVEPYVSLPAVLAPWAVGDEISFAGGARDHTGAELDASALSWEIGLWHCIYRPCRDKEYDCHRHTLLSLEGVAGGSLPAPNHNYPSFLELVLTATAHGLTRSVTVTDWEPRWINLTLSANVDGVPALLGEDECETPCRIPAITNSAVSLHVPRVYASAGAVYEFVGWEDGEAALDRTEFVGVSWDGSYLREQHFFALYRKVEPLFDASLAAPALVAAEPQCHGAQVFWGPVPRATAYLVRWHPSENLFVSVATETVVSSNEMRVLDRSANPIGQIAQPAVDAGLSVRSSSCTVTTVGTNADTHLRVAAALEAHVGPVDRSGDITYSVAALSLRDGVWYEGPPSAVALTHATAAAQCDGSCPLLRVAAVPHTPLAAAAASATAEQPPSAAWPVVLTAGEPGVVTLELTSVLHELADVRVEAIAIDGVQDVAAAVVHSSADGASSALAAPLDRHASATVALQVTMPAELPGGPYALHVRAVFEVVAGGFEASVEHTVPLLVAGRREPFRIDLRSIPTELPSSYTAYSASVLVHAPEPGYELVIDILDENYGWYGGCDLALDRVGWHSYQARMLNVNVEAGATYSLSSYIRPIGTSYKEAVFWWNDDPLYAPLQLRALASDTPPDAPALPTPLECVAHGCEEAPTCALASSGVCNALTGECEWTLDPECTASVVAPVPQPAPAPAVPELPVVPDTAAVSFATAVSAIAVEAGAGQLSGLLVHQATGGVLELVVNVLQEGTWQWLGGGVRIAVPSMAGEWQALAPIDITHQQLPCEGVRWSLFLGPVGGDWTQAVASASLPVDLTADPLCA